MATGQEQRKPQRQLRRLYLLAGLQPLPHPRRDGPQLQRRRHQLPNLPRREGRELPQPRQHTGWACIPGSGSQRPDDPQQPARAEPHRHLLVLGREVRAGREAIKHRRQPRLRHLDRPQRHRQRDAGQRRPQAAARSASCSATTPGAATFGPTATRSKRTASRTAAAPTASPSTWAAKPKTSASPPTRSARRASP